MLIVNADDWGRCREATDRSLACYQNGRISSASVMVFMEDSVRAAGLAREAGIDVGLHLNFSEEFTGPNVPADIGRSHAKIRRFLKSSKYALLLYHPFLQREFRSVVQAQLQEYATLFGEAPSHIDGHQHMHLCSNMLLQELIPSGSRVRRSFSFRRGEKGRLNRAYRSWVDRRLARRHRLVDYFFALSSNHSRSGLAKVTQLAEGSVVELMAHPQVKAEYDCLMSREYEEAIAGVSVGGHSLV